LRARAAVFFFVSLLLVIYLPGLGHGLIRDDYAWIAGSRVGSVFQLPELFSRHNGFYRPLVSLSFWADERLFGLEPFGYGLTNLAFFLADVALVALLARALGMAPGIAWLAAFVWAFNPHGINMALLWTSGRTSLLLVLFSLACAIAFLRGWHALATLCMLAALFCKEEALLLPATLAAWALLQKRSLLPVLPLVACDAVYLWLRAQTGAYTPATAPGFYKPSLDPGLLATNVLEYADRACTFPLALVLVTALVARARPRPDARERVWVLLGLAWLVFGYALTLFLPVRSSLYACFPSVGSALMAAALLGASLRGFSERAQQRLLVAAAALAVLLVPVYWNRNARWIEPARVATRVLRVAAKVARGSSQELLVFEDDPGARHNLAGAFAGLLQDAVRLASGRPELRVRLETPPLEKAPSEPHKRLRFRNGVLEEVR
jgi:hypothetical protein